jgi:hypothetical protein
MTLRTPQGVLSSRSLSFPPSMMPLSQSGILAFTPAPIGYHNPSLEKVSQ